MRKTQLLASASAMVLALIRLVSAAPDLQFTKFSTASAGARALKFKIAYTPLVGVVVTSIWLGIHSPANATLVTVNGAVWSGTANTGVVGPPGNSCCVGIQTPVIGPGTTSTTQTGFFGDTVSSQVQAAGKPFPSITASATASASSESSSATAIGQLIYYLEITGPTPTALLDVNTNSSLLSTAGSNSSNSSGEIQLSVGGNLLINKSALGGVGDGSFTTDDQLTAGTGTQIEVIMYTEVSAGTPDDVVSSATGYIDPFFSIDPSVPNADEYSIVTSSGIGNSPGAAVPEPSALGLILLGCAGLGWVYGRKRNFPGGTAF